MKPDCLILGAGEGTRMRPLTSKKPKVMLPAANKPLLEHVLEKSYEFINEYYVTVGYQKDKIKNYFGRSYRDKKINYIEQNKINGTAKAIGLAKDKIKRKFLTLYGDTYIQEKMVSKIANSHSEKESATMALKKMEDLSSFGAVNVDNNLVQNIKEKPEEPISGYANLGIYMFEPKIFDYIERTEKSERGEYEITDTLEIMLEEQNVGYINYDGYWSDVGRPWNLLDLNELLASEIEELREEKKVEDNVTIKGTVQIGEGTVIKGGTYIEGPVLVGENCKLGPNAYIRPFTSIGDNCHVGSSVEIKNSIIMDGSNVPHLSYVGDSIIGENCNLGAGTNVANLRHDKDNIKMKIKGEFMDTKRRKFGVVMGDGVKTGINATIFPGRKIGSNVKIDPGSVVKKNF